MIGAAITRNSLLLGIFAAAMAGILGITALGTSERIQQAEKAAAAKALLEIIPLERHSNDLLMDTQDIGESYWAKLGLKTGGKIHLARNEQGQLTAIIVPAIAADGYSGDIKLIVGINIDGSLAGVRVLSHNETPGLGDRIDLKKSPWILNFDGKSLNSPQVDLWAVKKDKGEFDQFTGATITPRAVVGQVLKTLQYFQQDKERLLKLYNESPSIEPHAK